jgi:hypothetical protein
MNDQTSIQESIWNQFGASLDMLENAINMCPDEHWDTQIKFWYTAFHCFFWTDYYLSTDPSKFQPPTPFTFSEFNPTDKTPEKKYHKNRTAHVLRTLPSKSNSINIWIDDK